MAPVSLPATPLTAGSVQRLLYSLTMTDHSDINGLHRVKCFRLQVVILQAHVLGKFLHHCRFVGDRDGQSQRITFEVNPSAHCSEIECNMYFYCRVIFTCKLT